MVRRGCIYEPCIGRLYPLCTPSLSRGMTGNICSISGRMVGGMMMLSRISFEMVGVGKRGWRMMGKRWIYG